jgi:hypothetical protein
MDRLEDSPWLRTLVGVLLLLVGLACLAFVAVSLGKDVAIWFLGQHTTAEVEDLWVEQIGDNQEGELQFNYLVRYHFAVPGGEVITRTVRLDVREWSTLTEGGPLAVIYFPLYPGLNRLEDARFIPLLVCSYVPIALLGWLGLSLGWYLLRPRGTRPWWFGGPGESATLLE